MGWEILADGESDRLFSPSLLFRFSAPNLSAKLLLLLSRFKRGERNLFQSDIGPHDRHQVRVRQ